MDCSKLSAYDPGAEHCKGGVRSAILILQVPKTNPAVRIRGVWLEWWSNAQGLQEPAEDSMQLRRMGAVG